MKKIFNRFFQILKRLFYFIKTVPLNIIKHLALSFMYVINSVRGLKISSPPIFIVGCGHSGTSLLLAILGSHSEIYPFPKESGLGYKSSKKARQISKYFDFLTIANGKQSWVEKTPKHINRIGTLLKLFPEAKILLMLRDGRDVAYSIKKRTGSIEKGIQRWVKDNVKGEKYWSHSNVYVLKYEVLIKDFDSTMKDIFSFLNKRYEPDIKNYYKKPKYFYSTKIKKPTNVQGQNHNLNRNWQINQPIFDGRGRWKKLSNEEKKIVKKYANKLLLKYKYISNKDW